MNPYARLLYWEVWNFMSFEYAKVEFDERNIINLKGYNDSGKSAMLTALKVLMLNSNQQKQVGFIQDDKDYFRIIATFEDGVRILRDKYLNGQSLYEMYKDGSLVFSTKVNNALTRVSEVPEPIEQYLGLVTFDGSCLNVRSCFEKQLGVQNTGSENYKMFTTVLRSEEIASAGAMLNADRNKLASDISSVDMQLSTYKSMYTPGITQGMVDMLKVWDEELSATEERLASLSALQQLCSELESIVVYPELTGVDTVQLGDMMRIRALADELSGIVIYPDLVPVDDAQERALQSLMQMKSELKSIVVYPELSGVSSDRVDMLVSLRAMVADLQKCENEVTNIDLELDECNTQLTELQSSLSNLGVRMVKCPGCGQVFSVNEEHEH